jgi:hypothetical protein
MRATCTVTPRAPIVTGRLVLARVVDLFVTDDLQACACAEDRPLMRLDIGLAAGA